MGSPGFVHLHVHSEYSLLDGASRIDDIIAKAVEYGMPSVALTDHGVMYGNISFYSAARKAGIKPILGCEVYVAPRSRTQRDPRLDRDQYHLVLLAKNENGYRNLIKLVSIAQSEGFYYKPRVDKEILAAYNKDLIAMTACLKGEVPQMILRDDFEQAEKSLGEYVNIFGSENVYLELQDHGLDEQQIVNAGIVRLAEKTGLKLVATNDNHYTSKADSELHDVLLCIQTGSTLDDPGRMRFGSPEFYFKSQSEMAERFTERPDALANTLEVAERCSVEFDFGRSKLPDPGVPENVDPADYMAEEARNGLRARLGGEIPENYQEQLEYECGVINECGFPLYMLITRDFTDFARHQGICVGVRGSAAGSIVCYGLGITDVDPIEYGLTFERFLNPERVEMPDVDLDIQDDRRDELIQYVIDKYGKEHVGQIATFGSLKARAAVRDCGRVLGVDLAEVDKVAKMIPTIPVGTTIDEAIEENPDMKAAYTGRTEVRKLIDTARSLEGLNRNVGVHAAGVLISDDPLDDHIPVQHGGKGEVVAQLDKKDIQKVGLLKMDFLGLANLTILANAVKNVKRHRNQDIDVLNIPLDDKKTFDMLSQGDTSGVFQLEGAGMRRNVVALKPNSVRELAAIVALYRPGPMAEIPKFVKAKFGQAPINYLHPVLEPILEETYGIICYQDQVLRIAQAVGGFTLGQADILRKAMSKKNQAVMEEQGEKFMDGAEANGIDRETAEKIYRLIEPFAGYAFNKAHAVCYAFVAYRTAYLKANYPVEYYAALLSANMDDKEKLALYVQDCKRLGIEVLPPDVNSSSVEFEVENGAMRFGLGAVKGCGRAVIEAMVEARESGAAFSDLFDFCERVQEKSPINKATVECLIKIGAFASIHKNRAQLLEMLPAAVSAASAKIRDQKNGQAGLFGSDSDVYSRDLNISKYGHVTEFGREEIFAMEKDLVGLYLSGHPLEKMRGALEKHCTANAANYRDMENGQECTVGGIITEVQERVTRRHDKMAFVKLEDLYGTMSVTFFPMAHKSCEKHLIKENIVLIKGKASHREQIGSGDGDARVEVEIVADSIQPIRNGNGKTNDNGSRTVHIRVAKAEDRELELLRSVIEAHPGESPVCLHVRDADTDKKVITPHKVSATGEFVAQIRRVLGKESIKLV